MRDDYKSEQNPWKILEKESISAKSASQPATLPKMNFMAGIFQLICVHFRCSSFKIDIKEKLIMLKLKVYYVTQGILLLIFSGCSLYD